VSPAGQQYKACYGITAAAISASGARPWDFDAPIFSYMDAFLQRCTDLLEVCEAQLQFAPDAKLPVIGGTRGAEVEKNVADIQTSFKSLLGQMKGLGYDMLDIQAMQ
jgi:dynein heavy chain